MLQVAVANPSAPGPSWRVFLSHTSELRQYPSGGSYIDKAERAVIAAGHVVVDMHDFPSIDEAPAQVCIDRVKSCDVYVGIYGTRWGSPVRDRQEVSYTELEFDTATVSKGTDRPIRRLVFLLDEEAEDIGIPVKALRDLEHGAKQQVFLQKVRDTGLTLQKFANPDQLSQLVERSLRELAESERQAQEKEDWEKQEIERKEEKDPQIDSEVQGLLTRLKKDLRSIRYDLDTEYEPDGFFKDMLQSKTDPRLSSNPHEIHGKYLKKEYYDNSSNAMLVPPGVAGELEKLLFPRSSTTVREAIEEIDLIIDLLKAGANTSQAL
jgi:hypothetical protein